MMKTPFFSCFAKDLELFIQKKQEAGFRYCSAEYTLHQFDKFCTECCISKPVITKDLVNAWLESFKNMKVGTVSEVVDLSAFGENI